MTKAEQKIKAEPASQPKHTPGPWLPDPKGNGYFNSADGTPIGQVFDNPDSGLDAGDEPSDFNLALICAAPETARQRDDLLAACKMLIASATPNPLEHTAMAAAWRVAGEAIARCQPAEKGEA